jgi:hypothetical protein
LFTETPRDILRDMDLSDSRPEAGEKAAPEIAAPGPRKPDRPRKHPLKAKGPRGRPPGPARLRNDPDRYAIAYLIARRTLMPTTPPHELARDIAQLNACEIGSREEAISFAAALAEGRKVHLTAKAGTQALGNPQEKRWRSRDWANAHGERLARKADRVSNLPYIGNDDAANDNADASWLSRLVDAWRVAFGVCHGELPALALEDARALAARVGEASYFDRTMMGYVRAALHRRVIF